MTILKGCKNTVNERRKEPRGGRKRGTKKVRPQWELLYGKNRDLKMGEIGRGSNMGPPIVRGWASNEAYSGGEKHSSTYKLEIVSLKLCGNWGGKGGASTGGGGGGGGVKSLEKEKKALKKKSLMVYYGTLLLSIRKRRICKRFSFLISPELQEGG